MAFRMLADVVLLLHLGFVLFVAAGALVVQRWPRLAWVHLPCVLWGVFVEYSGRVCPLTPIEIALRHQGGQASAGGSFIDRYVTAVLYPAGLTRGQQIVLGSLAVGINLAVYGRWVLRRYVGRR